MWELDYKGSWVPKNWCFWTVVLEKTLENPLDCKEIQPVHPKGDQAWVFIGRTDAEAETPVLWPPPVTSWLIGKDPDAWRGWVQEEKGMTEDEMAGWHHRLDGHGFEWTPGVGDGQGGLACCDSWGRKESDTTEQLTWTGLNISLLLYQEFLIGVYKWHIIWTLAHLPFAFIHQDSLAKGKYLMLQLFFLRRLWAFPYCLLVEVLKRSFRLTWRWSSQRKWESSVWSETTSYF